MKKIIYVPLTDSKRYEYRHSIDNAMALLAQKGNQIHCLCATDSKTTMYYKSLNISCIDLDSFDFGVLDNSYLFVSSHHLIYSLALVNSVKNISICIYDLDISSFDFFLSQLDRNCYNEVFDLLKNSNCCFFENKLSFTYFVKKFYNCACPAQYIPYGDSNIESNNISCPDLVSTEEINIAYIGRIYPSARNALDALCIRLSEYYRLTDTKRRINIHIIGDGPCLWQVELDKYSPMIRLVFPGNLKQQELGEYLRNNIDLILCNGYEAPASAAFGVPLAINILDDNNAGDDGYVLFSENIGYTLSWRNDEFYLLNSPSFTISQLVDRIYLHNEKITLAKKCIDAYNEYHSLESVSNYILQAIKTTELTATRLFDISCIGKIVSNEASKSISHILSGFSEPIKAHNENWKATLKRIIKSFVPKSYWNRKYIKTRMQYSVKERAIRKYYKKHHFIKVAFMVTYINSFPTKAVFDEMLHDTCFDPYIIVIPVVNGTMKNQMDEYNKTYNGLYKIYGQRIIGGYSFDSDEYLEIGDEYQVIFFSNPYKHQVHPNHYVEYFLSKNVLPIYANYGYAAITFWNEIINSDFFNYMWRGCVENLSNLDYLKKNGKLKGKNALVTGYFKMDKLASIVPNTKVRKTIMICPHHTVWGWKTLNISNFLTYYEFFIKLPKMYPDINFVFRPHPLLFSNLKSHNIWTQKEIDKYLCELLANDNVIYDQKDEYLEQFADSDAMIHDCASYIAEYLYTGKPCCYMMKSVDETYKTLLPFGQKCMDNYYHAFNEEDIISFIENVVINGNDQKKNERVIFSQMELKVNYPHSSQSIIQEIKNVLGCE